MPHHEGESLIEMTAEMCITRKTLKIICIQSTVLTRLAFRPVNAFGLFALEGKPSGRLVGAVERSSCGYSTANQVKPGLSLSKY